MLICSRGCYYCFVLYLFIYHLVRNRKYVNILLKPCALSQGGGGVSLHMVGVPWGKGRLKKQSFSRPCWRHVEDDVGWFGCTRFFVPENKAGRYFLGSKATWMTEDSDDVMLFGPRPWTPGVIAQSFSHRTGRCVAPLEIRREELGRGGSFPFHSFSFMGSGISTHEPGVSRTVSRPPDGQWALEYGSFSTCQALTMSLLKSLWLLDAKSDPASSAQLAKPLHRGCHLILIYYKLHLHSPTISATVSHLFQIA